ncbi:MAG: UDP-N-acetylmuramate dehydrogenase [Clostridia bacterium]
MKQDIFDKLKYIDIKSGVPMSAYTSFKIGGPAYALVEPQTPSMLLKAIAAADECGLEYEIIGNGTNLLVSDAGINALVIRVCGTMANISRNGDVFCVGAGALMSAFAKNTVEQGYMGLEWAAGIPGTVGGAVAMNAGAYGGEIKHTLCAVDLIKDGRLVQVIPVENDMGYRYSVFAAPSSIVVAAYFKLANDDGNAKERMDEFTRRRREKQPLQYPSAGSVFKRPDGYFAGALIEQAGLKGANVGDAQVSEVHAGFIINRGKATCDDVIKLITLVQQRVLAQSGVKLEPEVKLIGDFAT